MHAQAILESIVSDEAVVRGLGAAQALSTAKMDKAPQSFLNHLKQGPSKHLQQHTYEYHKKASKEIAHIRKVRNWQQRSVALAGSAILSIFFAIGTFASKVAYDQVYLPRFADVSLSDAFS